MNLRAYYLDRLYMIYRYQVIDYKSDSIDLDIFWSGMSLHHPPCSDIREVLTVVTEKQSYY